MCKTVPEGKQKNSSILHAHVRKITLPRTFFVCDTPLVQHFEVFHIWFSPFFTVDNSWCHGADITLSTTNSGGQEKCWRRYRESMRILSWLWKLWMLELLNICWCSCDFTHIKSFFACIQSYTYDVYVSLVCSWIDIYIYIYFFFMYCSLDLFERVS